MRIYKKFLLPILITILLLNILPSSGTTGSGLNAKDVWRKLNSINPPLLIDIRIPETYELSHIPTAVNIPYEGDVGDSTTDLIRSIKENEIILYCSCDQGVSAQEMAKDLEEHQLSVMYMNENFNYWPYETVSGPDPGSLEKIDIQTSNQIESNNGQNDNIGPFFAINLISVLIIGSLLIVKKVKK